MYQVYCFAPEPDLAEECEDVDDAIARCDELVHEEGYPCAEVWDAGGDRVYRATIHTPGWRQPTTSLEYPPVVTATRCEQSDPPPEPSPASPPAAVGHDAPRPAPVQPSPRILGGQETGDQWFGLAS